MHATEEEETVFHHRHTVHPGGDTTDTVLTDAIWTEYDDPQFAMDFDLLRDSQDRHYYFVTDVEGDEAGTMHWDFRLVRYTPEFMDEAEREATFREAFPDATDEVVADYMTGKPYGELTRTVDPRVVAWIDEGPEDELRAVGVQLVGEPTIQVPRARGTLAEPAHYLEQFERRLVAIEARRAEILDLQAELLHDLEARGGEWVESYVLLNAFEAIVTPQQALWLSEDPRVHRLYFDDDEDDGPVSPTGTAARHFHQVQQFVDHGYDGSLGSTLTTVGRMLVGVIDGQVDSEHPAFRDAQGNRRLFVWERFPGTSVWLYAEPSTWDPNMDEAQHGTRVVSQLTASLNEGQDPTVRPSQWDPRSGMSPEPMIFFWHKTPFASAVNAATAGNPAGGIDIINRSGSKADTECMYDHYRVALINAAVRDYNVFFLNTPGNTNHPGTTCTARSGGTAAGSFTVSAVREQAQYPWQPPDLQIAFTAARGDKSDASSLGNAIIDMTAFSKRDYGALHPQTYGSMGTSSSEASPMVAGAAANLKHNLLAHGTYSDLADEVGYLYALMLLMGDGRLQDGTYAQSNEQYDDLFGAGIMRMRMIHSEGLDYPYRLRMFRRTVYDGQTDIKLPVNPDSQGVNQPLPAAADVFRSTAWWLEERLGRTNLHPAKMRFDLCRTTTGTWACTASTYDDHKKRQRRTPGAGETLEVRLRNVVVPGGGSRKVYAVTFFEDLDRDDADGPTCADEIDMSCEDCCAQPQVNCPAGTCD